MSQTVEINNDRISIHLYRIAQEALSNAVRHGRPRRIKVDLSAEDGAIKLAICNDGRGFPKECHGAGLGLRSMRYRASMLGGALEIRRGTKGGTVVTCSIPTTLERTKP